MIPSQSTSLVGGPQASKAMLAGAYLLLTVLVLYPLMLVAMPPLLDYPLHVARAEILNHLAEAPELRAIYQAEWRPIPNLAMDLLIPPLLPFLSVEAASRVVLALCLTVTVAGVAILHRVNFGCWSWWPLWSGLPAYHGALMAGFVNFSIGLALTPLAIALWICVRDRPFLFAVLVHGAVVAVLYFCHVLALGVFGVVLAAFELSRRWSEPAYRESWSVHSKQWAVLLAPFILAAAAYIAFSMAEVLGRPHHVLYGEWRPLAKLRGVLMPVLTYDHLLDATALAIMILVPLALFYRGNLEIKASFVAPVLLLLGLFILLPGQIMDSSFIMDRLPIAAVLLAIAATRPTTLTGPIKTVVVAAILLVTAVRTSVIAENWLASDAFYKRATIMSEQVEQGASIVLVSPFSSPDIHDMDLWRYRLRGYPDWHFALINIPTLHSLPIPPLTRRSTFSQLHFVWPDKQVLRLTPAYRPLAYGDGANATHSPSAIFAMDDEGRARLRPRADPFRYILVLYRQHLTPRDQALVDAFEPLYADEDMVLIDRMDPPSSSACPVDATRSDEATGPHGRRNQRVVSVERSNASCVRLISAEE